jgi:hypothetical protein
MSRKLGEVCWKILLKLGGVRAAQWENVVLADAVLPTRSSN